MNSKRIYHPTEKAHAVQKLRQERLKRKANNTGGAQNKRARVEASSPSTPISPQASPNSIATVTNTQITVLAESRVKSEDDTDHIEKDSDEAPEPEESSEAELGGNVSQYLLLSLKILPERIKKDWSSPIYGFFASNPIIEYVGGRRSHVFKCRGKGCNKRVRRFLDKSDAKSTSGLHRHIKKCWGEDVHHKILKAKNIQEARHAVKSYIANRTITAAFERKGNVQNQYSHRQHSKVETR